ncbi:MAG: phosphoribosyltransferase family protein [Terriglobales bacterium]
MDLIPSEAQVNELLEATGALQHGHFLHPSGGTHSDAYLQLPMAMRHFWESKTLSVALSRQLRADDEVRRCLPNVSIVAPATGGLPVAYGVAEALRAAQTYWAEKEDGQLAFRQFMEHHAGERVILVDDILRTGAKLKSLQRLAEGAGARVMALAVLVHQPFEGAQEFPGVPLFKLTTLQPRYWHKDDCPLCREGAPLTKVRV